MTPLGTGKRGLRLAHTRIRAKAVEGDLAITCRSPFYRLEPVDVFRCLGKNYEARSIVGRPEVTEELKRELLITRSLPRNISTPVKPERISS